MIDNRTHVRDIGIDFAKILLMYLVVLGHIINVGSVDSLKTVYRIIYWFHMPAFFFITGYLTNLSKESFGEFTRRKAINYLVPYFTYCLLIFVLFRPRILAHFFRTFYSGGVHAGPTGPFWYISCLFMTLLFFKFLAQYKNIIAILVALIMWIVAHYFKDLLFLPTPSLLVNPLRSPTIPLPWGISQLFISAMFFLLGQYANKTRLSKLIIKKKLPPLIIGVSLLILVVYRNYEFDMKKIEASHTVLDVFIPMVFTLLVIELSAQIVKCFPDSVRKLVVSVSKSSLVCLYIHMAVIHVLYDRLHLVLNEYGVFALALLIWILAYIFYQLCLLSRATSLLFLGLYKRK